MPEYDSLIDSAVNHPLLTSALANQHFREIFMSSLNHIATNRLSYDRAMSRLSEYLEAYQPLMNKHYARFGNTSWAYQPNIDSLCDYLAKRPEFIVSAVSDDLSDYNDFEDVIARRRAEILGLPDIAENSSQLILPVLIEPQEEPAQADAGAVLAEQLAGQVQQDIVEDVAAQ